MTDLMNMSERDANRVARQARHARRKAKHRKDYNHGKGGYVGGNPRYNGSGSDGVAAPTAANFRQYATAGGEGE